MAKKKNLRVGEGNFLTRMEVSEKFVVCRNDQVSPGTVPVP